MKYVEKESVTLEFKQQLSNHSQIAKTVVAFCNQFGGKIIIGIDDQQNICGVNESNLDETIDALQQSIYKTCTPTILPSIYTQRIHDKLILIIEVSSGMNKPYFVTSLGLNEGVFIRAGAHTVKATTGMIQELIWKGKGLSVDEMPVYSASRYDLDEDKFFNFLKEHRQHYQTENLDEQLRHYRVIIQEHQRNYPSLGGLLLFGKNIEKYLPEAFIICSHFQGASGRTAIATQDCMGSLFEQLHSAMNFVVSRLNKSFTITKIKRQEQLEIPELALREIIINAIVHRDYQLPGPIKIAIYEDRVEIFSPGNFPGPLKVDQLEMGITYIRNHLICKLFREAGYIEKLGSGFLTLFNSYRQYHLPSPKIIEGTGFIKCILPRSDRQGRAYQAKENDDEILDLFYANPEMNVREIIKILPISRQTAARRLSELVRVGKIKRIGKGPAVRYRRI